ncbi:LptF/LptG family permease [Luteolibacter sp. GHJ8]|jgi:lipopolysaccharide export LptBFGC system permease protein LptF|uniref:LptF/LptG family permease n=1 Tax=Luteolibacter rhizosphaerae TaxID=2989719 RepID=A0ABT3G1X4_9BACT|nr:LptF/LptG family permease [Luteolibacter rhizosphaerae]MCW1913830.1 LptF/LptG family permease [Luteolibacter rhizosphaerae]
MRLSDRYIGRQVLMGTVFAILLLSTILIMGSVFQKIRPLLVEFGAPISIIWDFLISVIPFSLIYTIPWAFLSAVLLVFGRMSSDHELTGFRVAGISLTRLSAPVFVIGAALSALCLWLNVEVAPKSNKFADDILIRAFFMDPRSMLRAAAEEDGLDRLEESAKNARVYLDESDGTNLKGLHLFVIPDPNAEKPGPARYVHAMRAQAVVDDVKKEFRFHLFDAYFESTKDDGKPEIAVSSEAVPAVVPFELRARKDKPSAMTNDEIYTYLDNRRLPPRYAIGRYWAEAQRRYSSSFACLAFAFIGVPLGIKARRKDTSTGLILSLLIGAAYFICGMGGGTTKEAVLAGLWGPNIVCILLGLYLLRRARFR